jgi:hypothetical protein
MAAVSGSRCLSRRLVAMLLILAFSGALAASAAWVQPAAATRILHISVNRPGTVVSGTTVVMRCRAKDQAGKAIRGVEVTFRWRLPEGLRTHHRTTDASGLARASRIASCGSSAEFSAKVVVTATWRSQVKKVIRYFTVTGGT